MISASKLEEIAKYEPELAAKFCAVACVDDAKEIILQSDLSSISQEAMPMLINAAAERSLRDYASRLMIRHQETGVDNLNKAAARMILISEELTQAAPKQALH